MDYEIVHLLERSLLVLPPVRLSNSDVNLSEKIGSMYHNFYERCSQIGCAVNGNPICVYSNYARDLKGNFDPSIGIAKNYRKKSIEERKKRNRKTNHRNRARPTISFASKTS